jgi:hypothetical protein
MSDIHLTETGTGTITPAAAPITESPWFTGAAEDVVGHIQNRGWDKLDPKAAALAAVQAHREAEKFVGAPAAQLARIPTDPNDTEGWARVYEKLGVPKDVSGYDLSSVKLPDGSDLDAPFADFAKKTAAELHLSPAAAAKLASDVVKFAASQEATDTGERAALLATQKDSLKTNWGSQYEANLFVATRAAQVLGVTPEAVAALEKEVGYDKVMEMFRTIGTKIGEDKFVSNQNPAIPGVMTREQAVARKGELMADTQWRDRYMAGGAAEAREMTGLNKLIVSS